MLPAAVCGLDIGAIRAGAANALAPILAGKPAAERVSGSARGKDTAGAARGTTEPLDCTLTQRASR